MKKTKIFRVFSILISILLVISAVFVAYQAYVLSILPNNILWMVIIILVLIVAILLLLLNFSSKRVWSRLVSSILVIACSCGLFIGTQYMSEANGFIDTVTNTSGKIKHTVQVYALKSSKISEPADLMNKKVGVLKDIDTTSTSKSWSDLKHKSVNVTQKKYKSVEALAKALYDKEVSAIIISDSYVSGIEEIDNYKDFGSKTVSILKTIYYTKDNLSASAVSDITSKPFTIEISGNDNYGGLESVARSDVNMLVTVNPKTHDVLMTSIPRDYYIQYACEDGECPVGELDKLTHTGMTGLDTTRDTLEQMLDVDINYTVRLDFEAVKAVVDAVGGIDVYVKKGYAVDQFYTNPGVEGVHEGKNHLDGARALAYARERYAYEEGDRQRVKNQQQVLKALINKVLSSNALTHYNDLLKAMSGVFETNMTDSEIKQFVQYQLQDNPKWNFESYVLDGQGDMLYCAMAGQAASVLVPDQRTIDIASKKIKAVIAGKKASSVSSKLKGEFTMPDYMTGVQSQDTSSSYSSDTSQYTTDQSVDYSGSTYYDASSQAQTQTYTPTEDTTYQQDASVDNTVGAQ